jgi:hypothetical protein
VSSASVDVALSLAEWADNGEVLPRRRSGCCLASGIVLATSDDPGTFAAASVDPTGSISRAILPLADSTFEKLKVRRSVRTVLLRELREVYIREICGARGVPR